MSVLWLPWVGFAAGLIGLFLVPGARGGSSPPDGSAARPGWSAVWLPIGLLAVAGLLAAVAAGGSGPLPGLGIGIAAGLALALVLGRIGTGGGAAVPAGLSLVAVGIGSVLPAYLREPFLAGAVFGLGMGGWVMGDELGRWPRAATLFLGAVVAATLLGARVPDRILGDVGVGMAVVAVVAGVVAGAVRGTGLPATGKVMASAAVLLVVASAGGFLVGTRLVGAAEFWPLLPIGIAAGLVVGWVVGDDDVSSLFGVLLGTAIWLGAATLAFASSRGLGTSLLLMGGVAAMLTLGVRRPIATLGPLAAIVAFRVYRELQPEAARAFDIGQHYTMLGLLLGALGLAMMVEWRRTHAVAGPRGGLAAAAWGYLAMLTPFAAAMLIAAKGYVGVLMGLGLAPIVLASAKDGTGDAVPLVSSLTLAMAVAYGAFGPVLELTRAEKVDVVAYVAIGLIVLAGLVALGSKREGAAAEVSPA
ncbi:MAG: hypothetical protein SNJ74_11355 [Fimbriimonadaceae bacterium]